MPHNSLKSLDAEKETGTDSKDGNRELLDSGSDSSRTDQAPPARDVHGFRWVLVVISLISATFLWGLDGTITADIQATFVRDFHSIEKLAYNSVGFFLGAAAVVLTWGQLFSQLDCKWVFVAGVVVFEVGSTICGAAPNIDALIVGRAICGLGGSGMYVGVLTLLSMTTTEAERALYMGFPGITWGVGTVLGPIVGGAFAQSSATWRWGFYINLVVGALLAPVYLFLVPSRDPRPGVALKQRWAAIDWLGTVLLTGTTTALLLAICFGGLTFPWRSGSMAALWAVAGVLFLLFAIQQATSFGAKQTVFPTSMMKEPKVLIIFLNECFAATACFLPCYFIPLYFQYIRNERALTAGVHLLPFIICGVSTVMLCGAMVSKLGRWIPWFFYGGTFVLIGGSLMYTVDEHTPTANVYGYIIMLGSGWGAYIQMPFNAAQECVSAGLIPAAVGLITWGQLAAPAVTLSMANAIFLNRAKALLTSILPPRAPVLGIMSGVNKAALQALPPEKKQQAVHAIVKSLSLSYILIIVGGALTLVLSVGLPFLFARRRAGS